MKQSKLSEILTPHIQEFKAGHTEKVEAAILQWMDEITEGVIKAIDGNRVDREATRNLMESKGATDEQILNMEIEADDLDDTIDLIIKSVRAEIRERMRS